MPILLLNVGGFDAEHRLEVVLCGLGHLLVGEVRSEGIGRPAPPFGRVRPLPGNDRTTARRSRRVGRALSLRSLPGQIGGNFRQRKNCLRPRFRLSACGRAMAAPRGNPVARGATVLATVPLRAMLISTSVRKPAPLRSEVGEVRYARKSYLFFLARRSFKKAICSSVRRREGKKGFSGSHSGGIRQSVPSFSIGACCPNGFRLKPNVSMPAAIASRASGATKTASKIEP